MFNCKLNFWLGFVFLPPLCAVRTTGCTQQRLFGEYRLANIRLPVVDLFRIRVSLRPLNNVENILICTLKIYITHLNEAKQIMFLYTKMFNSIKEISTWINSVHNCTWKNMHLTLITTLLFWSRPEGLYSLAHKPDVLYSPKRRSCIAARSSRRQLPTSINHSMDG